MENLARCTACVNANRVKCAGACACPADGADIRDHADAGYCPKPVGPEFGDGVIPKDWKSRGLGDTIAKLAAAVGIKPCKKCKERQAAANRAAPY